MNLLKSYIYSLCHQLMANASLHPQPWKWLPMFCLVFLNHVFAWISNIHLYWYPLLVSELACKCPCASCFCSFRCCTSAASNYMHKGLALWVPYMYEHTLNQLHAQMDYTVHSEQSTHDINHQYKGFILHFSGASEMNCRFHHNTCSLQIFTTDIQFALVLCDHCLWLLWGGTPCPMQYWEEQRGQHSPRDIVHMCRIAIKHETHGRAAPEGECFL